jgi:primary-amine oxidase
MKVEKSFIDTESSLNWAPNDAAIYAVVNKDVPNKYGEYRGYRIKPGMIPFTNDFNCRANTFPAGTIHLTVKDSTNVQNAGHYVTHDFHVTQFKDTEPRASHGNNIYNPSDPLVDFSKFLNNESLDQEDL